jgi:hypothetical protein
VALDRALLGGPSTSPLEAMKLPVIVVTAVVVGVAAALLVVRFPAPSHLIGKSIATHAPEPDAPIALKQQAACMLRVLTVIPKVKEPKLGTRTSEGWKHPFLEYIATWDNGFFPIRFEARKSYGDYKGYSLVTAFVTPPPDFDESLMESIIQAWKTTCDARIFVEIN